MKGEKTDRKKGERNLNRKNRKTLTLTLRKVNERKN